MNSSNLPFRIVNSVYGKSMLLFLFAIGIYFYALNGEFLYDDIPFIVDNPAITSLKNIPSFFADPATHAPRSHDIWRPLRTVSFAVDHRIWGSHPAGYHLTSVLLHALNGVLAYCLLRMVFACEGVLGTKKDGLAFFTALLFIAHPVQVESVAWIASRGDVLYAFFALLTLWTYIAAGERTSRSYGPWRSVSLACFAAALFSKETALMVPLAIMCYARLVRYYSWRKSIYEALCYGGIAVTWFCARYIILGHMAQRGAWGGSFMTTLLTVITVLGKYAAVLVWPARLRAEYYIPLSTHITQSTVIIPLCVVIIIMMFYRYFLKKDRVAAFNIAWVIIFLLPTLQIFPILSLFQEHFLYLSVMGYAFMLVMATDLFARTISRISKKISTRGIFSIVLIPVISGYVWATVHHTYIWQDAIRLWEHTEGLSPRSVKAPANLGTLYYQRGDLSRSIAAYRRALSLNEEQPLVYTGLGMALARTGDREAAEKALYRALELDCMCYQAYYNLGCVAVLQNDPAEAIHYFDRALEICPSFEKARHNLAEIYRQMTSRDQTSKIKEQKYRLKNINTTSY